jgi:hypothetical protein
MEAVEAEGKDVYLMVSGDQADYDFGAEAGEEDPVLPVTATENDPAICRVEVDDREPIRRHRAEAGPHLPLDPSITRVKHGRRHGASSITLCRTSSAESEIAVRSRARFKDSAPVGWNAISRRPG